MTESEFISTFEELMANHVEKLKKISIECRTPEKIRTIINSFQGSIDTVRILLKYMQLDLEATRREACASRGFREN